MKILGTVLVLLYCSQVEADLLETASLAAARVQEAMHVDNWFHYRNFGTWSYEGGTITRGLWELQLELPELDMEPFLNSHLDYFMDNPDEFGYRILNNESLTYNDSSVILPWLYSIGDNIGLFPVVYADRLRYSTTQGLFPVVYADRLRYSTTQGWHPPRDDEYIVSEVVEKYIYGYPWHLPDGTISRPITWLEEGFIDMRGGGVWVDDMYMGTALLVQQALLTQEIRHLEEAAKQVLHMANILQDSETGLYKHGYHYWTDHHSCCFWGRGNGWAILAVTEVMEATITLGLAESNPDIYSRLYNHYIDHVNGLVKLQSEGGLWHNILNNNSTFLETSCSAMFMTGISRGYRQGWLTKDSQNWLEIITRAWDSLQVNFLEDGTFTNIIGGTGIKDNEAGYNPSSTDYEDASPGVGNVLRSMAEMAKLEKHLGRQIVS